MGLNHAIALNAADSIAVEAFLNKKIAFNDIYKIVNATIIESTNKPYKYSNNNSIEEILNSDRECTDFALSLINK
jgi:1-deoxy-D-xylulose 5-phosphate reductoisomerase